MPLLIQKMARICSDNTVADVNEHSQVFPSVLLHMDWLTGSLARVKVHLPATSQYTPKYLN